MGKLKFLLVIIIFVLFLKVPCNALTTEQMIEDFISAGENANEFDYISEKVELNNIISVIFDLIISQFSNTSKLFLMVVSLILLVSILNTFDFKNKTELKNISSSVIAVTIVSICFSTLKSNIDIVNNTLDTAKVFSSAAIPVITTLSIASGESVAGAVFSSTMSLCSGLYQYISENILMSFVVIFLLLGIVSTYTTDFDIASLSEFIKKIIKWIISGFTWIFTFSISLQNVLAKAGDNLTKKGIQVAVGKFIPMVGSVLSGSVENIFALAVNTKISVSLLGVLIVVSIFLPVILGNLSYGFSLVLCKYISSVLGVTKLKSITQIIADTFFLIAGICSASAIMLIISFLLLCINIV